MSRDGTSGGGPLFSIITASWNSAAHIEESLRSVEAQTFRDFEHVVIDGGSTDGTTDILHRHAAALSLWVSERDEGISDAFNKGVMASKGRLLFFLGSDDCLADERVLDRVAGAMRAFREPYFFYGDINYVYHRHVRRIHRNYTYRRFCRYSCIPHQAMFLDRAFFDAHGLFSIDYRRAMDYEHTARFIKEREPEYMDIVVSSMRRYGAASDPWLAHAEMDAVRLKYGLASRPAILATRVILLGKMLVSRCFRLDW